MSIDWLTVAAQIVNFLVLVWLLKRFLYRPILDGIDAREAAISARMSEAARIREMSEKAAAEHRAEIARLKSGREGALEEARAAAGAERDAMLAETRARLERERIAREADRAEEARRYTEALHRKGASALVALTRKALDDLAGETLEQRIVARAVERLPEMADALRDAAGEARDAVVTSRDGLSDELRAQLAARIAEVLPGATVRYETDPEQSPGLSLRLAGVQLGWTVEDYVDGLEEVLDRGNRPEESSDAA